MSSLMWFRNDLRIDQNISLNLAREKHCQHAVFFVCKQQWQSHDMSAIKMDFIERRINVLGQELANIGIKLAVINAETYQSIPELLAQFCQQVNADVVFATKEPEWNEIQRDKAVIRRGVNLVLVDDDCVLPYGSVLNNDGHMFKVFTPFKRRWLAQIAQSDVYVQPPLAMPEKHETSQFTPVSFVDDVGLSKAWVVASAEIHQRLSEYIAERVEKYAEQRDIPSVKATSGISPYLAIGAVSVKAIVRELKAQHYDALESPDSGPSVWLSELAWRDFYRHLMVAYPDLSKRKSFKSQYDALMWPNSKQLFDAWCQGKTGFPIIDAAMRQLIKTGWMHNRLRMIVASFLTKHCLVDWRLGEQFFMRHLIDGDLSANNGGWQWASSSGADSVPYFRIFNPVTQSKKFDPQGVFIRKYLPELKSVPDKAIHDPSKYLASAGMKHLYPDPILDLSTARKQALEFYKG